MQQNNGTGQSGVTLALVLLILLVVTLVGVTTLNTSSIQTFIARNIQLKQVAFQNAESAVRAGERAWNAAINSCLNDAATCTVDMTPAMRDNIDSIDWDAITGHGVTMHGKYFVEHLGWRPVAGESGMRAHLYRITARGLGPNATAITYIQTLFKKCITKDGVACSST